ncbi:MAG TPA: condensation domain-containing protein, partial [Terriglobales bacterium]
MDKNVGAGFRLSPQQQHVCSLQPDSGPSPYHATCALLFEGPVEANSLRTAVLQAVSRHEILRTIFKRQPGMVFPFQIIFDQLEPSWHETDLSQIATDGQQQALIQLMQEASAFVDLAQGPLFRSRLIKLGPSRHVLVLSLPAMCADAGSLRNLAAEIGRTLLKEECLADVMQYADVTEWQHGLLEAGDEAALQGKEFWRKQEEADGAAVLPMEKPGGTFRPEAVAVKLEVSLA